ncbi:hypothetical protein [Rhizobium sp.]|uniref:hypothetical protein n=1 Tax=Rhizobium sp. TaxID=391 RepID=UPI0028AC1076
MFLEGIFGGGSQSGSTSQSSPSSGSSDVKDDETTTGKNNTAPSSGSQSDTVENYSPEETDDGTYGPMPPAEAGTDEPVDESASQPADVAEAEAAHAADGDVPTDEAVAEHSTSDEPSALPEDDSISGSEPDADASADQVDGSASTSAPAAGSGVRDFVTPLLADLHAISQRSSVKANEDVSASQRRAAANVHDQMIRQMLDQISATGTSGSSTQLFKSKDAEQTQSLPTRWYAEA